MPVVQTPASLLEPHNQLIRECKAYAANHWQMQYNQTILNTAEYLQLLQDKNKRPLLESALTRTRESLEKLLNQVPEVTPHLNTTAVFAAALMLDFGRPLADLAVYTGTGDEVTKMESPWFRRRLERSERTTIGSGLKHSASRPPSALSSL